MNRLFVAVCLACCRIGVTGSLTGSCGFLNYLQSGRIAGGNIVDDPDRYPFQVALYIRHTGEVRCGGSLISERYVLTAAHCVKYFEDMGWTCSFQENDLMAKLGEYNICKNEPNRECEVEIEKIIIHPSYNPKTFHNDIALIKLKSSGFCRPNIKAACIWRNTVFPGTKIWSIGWGKAHPSDPALVFNPILKQINGTIVNDKKCTIHDYMGRRFNSNLMICSQSYPEEYYTGPLQGDSGGPLLVKRSTGNYVIVGVFSFLSFATECGPNWCPRPTVYARVSAFVDWIEEHVQDSRVCYE